jgi:hypothetical protein
MKSEPPPIVAAARALFHAYVAATGLPITYSNHAAFDCRDLAGRGVTPADVSAVIARTRRQMNAGEGGFTASSLLWKNTLGKPDDFEGRVHLERQRRARAKGASLRASVEVREVREMPDGTRIARLVEAPKTEPKPILPIGSLVAAVKAELEKGAE